MGRGAEMTILPITYLGSVDYFAHLMREECIIDIGENWVKQTARNRAEILTAGGVAALTVPVHGGSNGVKIRTKDIRIDNSKRWQHTHWQALVSAYRNSPFFDHYEEWFAPIYGKNFEFLADLNLELLDVLTHALKLGRGAVKISMEWVEPSPDDLDLRGKKALRRVENPTKSSTENPIFQEYTQVFSDRTPFIPGLSIVDLLFCEGPSARELLR
jgi:hypothetical protein